MGREPRRIAALNYDPGGESPLKTFASWPDESRSMRLVRLGSKILYLGEETVTKYRKRILDPLLDRIDIHVEVHNVDYEKLKH